MTSLIRILLKIFVAIVIFWLIFSYLLPLVPSPFSTVLVAVMAVAVVLFALHIIEAI